MKNIKLKIITIALILAGFVGAVVLTAKDEFFTGKQIQPQLVRPTEKEIRQTAVNKIEKSQGLNKNEFAAAIKAYSEEIKQNKVRILKGERPTVKINQILKNKK